MIGKLLTFPPIKWEPQPNSSASSSIEVIRSVSSSPRGWVERATSSADNSTRSTPLPFRSRHLSSNSSAYGSNDSAPQTPHRWSREDLGRPSEKGFTWPTFSIKNAAPPSLNRDGSLYRQIDVRLVRGEDGFLVKQSLPFAERLQANN